MNRYFLVRQKDMPKLEDTEFGHYHYISLGSHGPAGKGWNLLCLNDAHCAPRANWVKFPPLYDSKTTLEASNVPHKALKDIGLTGVETTMEAVGLLGEIHPAMSF